MYTHNAWKHHMLEHCTEQEQLQGTNVATWFRTCSE